MPVALEWLAFVNQALFYMAALTLTGFSIWRTFSANPKAFSNLVGLSALLTLIFYAARMLLANAELGGGLGAALQAYTAHWIYAIYAKQGFLVFAAIASALLSLRFYPRVFSLVAAGALGASFAMAGHASALDAPGVWPWMVSIHALAAGFWIVAPVLLWPSPAIAQSDLIARVENYSAFALFIVPILFIAGGALALRLAGGWQGLTGTTYGLLLVVKLTIASLALAAGAFNKLVVTQKLRSKEQAGRQALKSALLLDSAVFTAVLTIIAWATTINGPQGH